MFGGRLVTVPSNSPHLRKSGSRPVVSDLGELGNSADEGFLHSLEANEMKGVSTPLSSPGIMPSPILLWRFKVLLYTAVAMLLIFPFEIFYLSSRYFLLRTIWRIVFPLQAITFAVFFLADILTSMAKVFSDLERSVCRMVHRQVATIAWFEADSVCGSHSVVIPVVLVLPYLFRFFQCL